MFEFGCILINSSKLLHSKNLIRKFSSYFKKTFLKKSSLFGKFSVKKSNFEKKSIRNSLKFNFLINFFSRNFFMDIFI